MLQDPGSVGYIVLSSLCGLHMIWLIPIVSAVVHGLIATGDTQLPIVSPHWGRFASISCSAVSGSYRLDELPELLRPTAPVDVHGD